MWSMLIGNLYISQQKEFGRFCCCCFIVEIKLMEKSKPSNQRKYGKKNEPFFSLKKKKSKGKTFIFSSSLKHMDNSLGMDDQIHRIISSFIFQKYKLLSVSLCRRAEYWNHSILYLIVNTPLSIWCMREGLNFSSQYQSWLLLPDIRVVSKVQIQGFGIRMFPLHLARVRVALG